MSIAKLNFFINYVILQPDFKGCEFMFNEFEREQKEKAFNYSKERFKMMDEFLNDENGRFRDEHTNYSYIFTTIARFINYKEDIWIKNKKTKNIQTNFSKDILDKYLFKGKLTSAKTAFLEKRKQNEYSFPPIKINNILSGKENDSIWIIDNIRDSIAHGHYYINFENNTIVIKNNHEDRLLNCELEFDLFLGLNELITEERIGGYTSKMLTTVPIIFQQHDLSKPIISSIKDDNQLRMLLKNNFIVSYCKVKTINETDQEKKYNDLAKFYNFNIRVAEELNTKFNRTINKDISSYYTKKMTSYIENNLHNYDISIFSVCLDDQTIDKVIKYIEEQPKFYYRNLQDQALILQELLRIIISHEELSIERGVVDLIEAYSNSCLRHYAKNKEDIKQLNDLTFSNVNSFRENKKLANLFILATTNFVSNKESIYDKYFDDYNEFDLSNFEYQDYSGYERLLSKLKVKNDELNNLNKNLYNVTLSKNKLNNNLLRAPKDKKQIIQNNINNLNNSIADLNNKIANITFEINDIMNNINFHKTDPYGDYINNNNKNFFNHLRNAFAHNNIKYLDDRIIYNRKILLEDYDDNKNLTFRCICRYYDLLKLFNNDLFLKAINNNETKKREK